MKKTVKILLVICMAMVFIIQVYPPGGGRFFSAGGVALTLIICGGLSHLGVELFLFLISRFWKEKPR